ncbi:MAG: hypothetical protein JWO10_607, partial [Microbacteriaceae bacterium]|nr:hypothetical protein [Microbacteriaceae bacterium]
HPGCGALFANQAGMEARSQRTRSQFAALDLVNRTEAAVDCIKLAIEPGGLEFSRRQI